MVLDNPMKEPTRIELLLGQLRELWSSERGRISQKWHRTLPFADYIVDRWEKAAALGFGEGTSIYDSSLVLGDVKVGDNTWIGPNTLLDGSGGLEIGSYCSIAAGVQIYSHDTVEWTLSGGQKEPLRSRTVVGSRCYLGPNCTIAKGVTIGDGCVIGAHSLVLSNIPSGSKAHGIPCRVVGEAVAGPFRCKSGGRLVV